LRSAGGSRCARPPGAWPSDPITSCGRKSFSMDPPAHRSGTKKSYRLNLSLLRLHRVFIPSLSLSAFFPTRAAIGGVPRRRSSILTAGAPPPPPPPPLASGNPGVNCSLRRRAPPARTAAAPSSHHRRPPPTVQPIPGARGREESSVGGRPATSHLAGLRPPHLIVLARMRESATEMPLAGLCW
jgi:hypothetical protein